MGLKLTKEEIWYLSDIAWYMKGYVDGKNEDDPNDFGKTHYEVLVKVISEVERDDQ